MHECQPKDRDQVPERKKVLQAIMESDDEGSEDCLIKFYFMAIEEEREEGFESAFEELFVEIIHMVKKNKELREQLSEIIQEKNILQ